MVRSFQFYYDFFKTDICYGLNLPLISEGGSHTLDIQLLNQLQGIIECQPVTVGPTSLWYYLLT